ncbi:hypothetical protein GCM10023323_45990 [Streptomyces thinghirensis]|uniref:Uncharacterized protein n=1 Tax=Streptomyces thinghirensis TaxID=551547 RepID=A0ABP9TAE1_9ACTN
MACGNAASVAFAASVDPAASAAAEPADVDAPPAEQAVASNAAARSVAPVRVLPMRVLR